LDLTDLPVERVEVEPAEVLRSGGQGWKRIGEEISERLAYRAASYVRLLLVRGKWVRIGEAADEQQAPVVCSPIVIAPVPANLWPRVMGDPSAIANVIVSKYDDVLPLHRQEKISGRQGLALPRSTQGEWLGAAYEASYRVVDAMFEESKQRAFCIATDSTSVPVRADGGCDKWGMFVFIADRDHVVFRHASAQDSTAVQSMLEGFRGHLLADAAAIFDVLYRDHGMTEVACWYHCRRYFWRALESDRERALEALALISKLFEINRECRSLPPLERTSARAARASPVLELLDGWVERHRDQVDPRGPLDAAIGYYENQRDALRRFLEDGRLRLDNNISEAQLRNVVLGRHNWKWFANETGLRWYATFRSLIASCALHGLNPQFYLEQLLRLAPHWPITRQLELAPKHWQQTVGRLGTAERAIITPPWGSTDGRDDAVPPSAAEAPPGVVHAA
jgi:transposase